MGEGTDRIEAHIEFTREQLGRNIDELEAKVRSIDVKHFPLFALAVAAIAGVFLAGKLQRKLGVPGLRTLLPR